MDHLLSKEKVARPSRALAVRNRKQRPPLGERRDCSGAEVRYLPSFERPGASQPPLFENRILQNMFFLSSSRARTVHTESTQAWMTQNDQSNYLT